MAAFDIYRANSQPAAKSGLNFRFISSAIAAVVAWNDQRVTRKALSTLTDRELDDIGLVRGDIEDIARSTVY